MPTSSVPLFSIEAPRENKNFRLHINNEINLLHAKDAEKESVLKTCKRLKCIA